MAKANKYCKYPVCRILYKTDNIPGWYMAEKSGSVEECQKICEEKKKSHTWIDYECRVDRWRYNEIDIPLRTYNPEASDLHRRTLLIYNPDDKKYYYPDEIMPYPQKSLSRPANKFCIAAKTEPADDKDGLIESLLEEEDDFKDTAARLYFNNKLGIVVITKPVMEGIPAFLNKLNSSGYSNLIIEEYWYTKFLTWKKGGNVRFIIQNYNEDDVEIIFDKLVPEPLFFNEFDKLCKRLKEGLQKVRKLYKQFRQEEELLKSLPWIYDTKNKNERLQEYIDIDTDCIKSGILNNFVTKVKDKSSHCIIDFNTKEKEICMHQGEFYYKVKNRKLIRFYYLERNNREILRYIKRHGIKINSGMQLAKLYSDMVKNSGREAINCYLGENEVTIYEDGGFDAPLSTPKEKEYLADKIYQIVRDKNKSEFLINDFYNLLGEYGIKTSSHYADRIMRISCAETYRIHHAREKGLIAADTPRRYDTIDFRIQPAGTLEIPWADCNRVVILINGQEIENIVREKEKEFFAACGLDVKSAGCYHCLWPSGLYEYLMDARLSHGKNKAPILCCTCDEVGCASVKVCVEYTKDSVIWKDFESCRKEWDWGLEYEFEYEAYEEFMQRIKALSDNWQR